MRRLAGRGIGETGFDKPEVSVSPLIDVSFLLLIFFLVTSTLLKKERDLSMRVPQPTEIVSVSPLAIAVGIENGGRVVLNPGVGEMLISSDPNQRELPLLEEHVGMVRLGAGEREVAVQLRVADEVTQQRVVDVLDCLAKLGVTSVGIVD